MSITMTTVILFAVFGVLLFLGVPISYLSPSALWRRLS
mgnify:CR=1 FL=1